MAYRQLMATILAHITVRPGAERHFEAVAREIYSATHRHETGVLRYEYWRGAEPRTYYTLLSFPDFNGFLAHQTSPHHESASPDFGQIFESLRLEWVDPIEGASPLPPTNMQPLRADANELWTRYHSHYAAQVASWWLELRPSGTP
jgi:quinol monooxygenase YgiN